jgi:hypothetical protein
VDGGGVISAMSVEISAMSVEFDAAWPDLDI